MAKSSKNNKSSIPSAQSNLGDTRSDQISELIDLSKRMSATLEAEAHADALRAMIDGALIAYTLVLIDTYRSFHDVFFAVRTELARREIEL